MYYDSWFAERGYFMAAGQRVAARWIESFKAFPPRQKPASFQPRTGDGEADRGRQQVMRPKTRAAAALAAFLSVALTGAAPAEDDPLPSWNDGPSRKAVVDFVARVTTEGGRDFVRPAERIAVFDNDGMLWAEQPMYFQLQARRHPAGHRTAAHRRVTIVSMKDDWKRVFAFEPDRG